MISALLLCYCVLESIQKKLMISEIWTFINDIEDCSPYFPIGIGSPSQYIGNRKKSFEPVVSGDVIPVASYRQLRRELDCFSIHWTTRYAGVRIV